MGIRERLVRLGDVLSRNQLDAAMVISRDNLAYFMGFEDALMLIARPSGEFILVVSRLDYERAMDTVGNVAHVVAYTAYDKPPRRINEDLFVGRSPADYLRAMGVRGAVGVDSLDSRISRELSSDFKLVDIGDELMRLRSIKDPDELEAMLMSIRITEETMGDVLGRGIVGMRERDAAALFYAGFMVRGAGDVAFKPIIASGENAAYPHHEPGPRVVGKGEFVVVDVGARYSLYCADITRTVATGPVDARLRDIYMAVLEAQRSAINAVSPGVPANQVDAAARGVLEEYGYGNYYIHSTGHGVGVVVHEKPYLGPTSGDTLRTGNVVTIEPGVYIKGLGGVRIEDMVLVTENGHRVLSNYPRDL